MKKIINVFVSFFILLSCFPLSISAAQTDDIMYVTAAIQNGEPIKIYPCDNVFYLPSSADITKLSFSTGEVCDLTENKTTDEHGTDCYKLSMLQGEFIFYHGENLPTVFVTTSKGLSYIEANKENRDKGAKITIVDEKGAVEYRDTADTVSEIKGRGNATFSYYKKPYQIKLSAKTEILGMEKSKTWILLANYTDQSALHNALAFSMGDALGVPYNIEYRFTNLYIDGKYRGLYMLCEKVQVDGSRVDIADLEKANMQVNAGVDIEALTIVKKTEGTLIDNTIVTEYRYVDAMKNPGDITGGYLVELDNNYGTREPCYFKTENGNVYVVKAPEYASREEVEYIAALFADMEEAIYSATGYNTKGKYFGDYMDITSFASVYTVQELMKNWDAYTSSMFFFKGADKDGVQEKIYCGPLWDLDNTLGNINFNKDFGTDTAYLWAQNGEFNGVVRTFAKNLMKHDDFQKSVEKSYAEAYKFTNEVLSSGGWLEENIKEIYPSVMMDRVRWKIYDRNAWLLNSAGHKSSVKFVWFETYGTADDTGNDTAIGFLRGYLSSRAEALKNSIGTTTATSPSESDSTTASTASTTVVTASTSGTTADMVTTSAMTVISTTADIDESRDSSSFSVVRYTIIGVMIAVVCICTAGILLYKKKK